MKTNPNLMVATTIGATITANDFYLHLSRTPSNRSVTPTATSSVYAIEARATQFDPHTRTP